MSFSSLISCSLHSFLLRRDFCAFPDLDLSKHPPDLWLCSKTFNLDWDVLHALNPGLDCNTFTPWTSLCIGGAGASCNTAVDGSGQCPDLNNAEKTVRTPTA